MTEVKRHVEIAGYGVCLPKQTVQFKNQTRYRVVEDEETQLDLAEVAIQRALENANLKIEDIDCLVSASAVGVQPIPCTAALIHERVAKGLAIRHPSYGYQYDLYKFYLSFINNVLLD